MNIESTVSKVSSPIDKFSPYIGAASALLLPNAEGNSAFTGLVSSITQISNGVIHAPEYQNIITDNMTNNLTPIAAAIVGYILKDATSNRTLSTIGKILQSIGSGYAVTYAALSVLYYSTHSPMMGSQANAQPQQTGSYTTQPLNGSTLNQSGMQKLAPYQSVYSGRPTAGSLYTAASGSRLQGN